MVREMKMKYLVKSLALATILSVSTTSYSIAADADIDVLLEPESTFVEFGDGWYLRGDITYNLHGRQSTGTAVIGQIGESLDYEYNDAVGIRAGFGYHVGSGLRLEFTGESVLNSEFNGTGSRTFSGSRDVIVTRLVGGVLTPFTDTVFFDSSGNVTGTTTGEYTDPTIAPIDGTETIDASYSASNFMINGYYDLPTMGTITPYVGAGIGAARINYSETRTWDCIADATEACGVPAGTTGTPVEDYVALDYDATYWRLSWQVAAGVAFKVSDKASIDVGYSYLNMGDGQKLNYADGTAIETGGITIHRINVGLRYEIW